MLIIYPIKLRGKLISNPEHILIRRKHKIIFTIGTKRCSRKMSESIIDYYNILANDKLVNVSFYNLKIGMEVKVAGTIVIQSSGDKREPKWITEVTADSIKIINKGEENECI